MMAFSVYRCPQEYRLLSSDHMDARGDLMDLVGPCSFIAAVESWFALTLKSLMS